MIPLTPSWITLSLVSVPDSEISFVIVSYGISICSTIIFSVIKTYFPNISSVVTLSTSSATTLFSSETFEIVIFLVISILVHFSHPEKYSVPDYDFY